MYQCFRIVFAAVLFAAPFSFAQAADCTDNPRTTGLSRIIAIDSSEGNYFGRLQYKQTAPLRKKEVILTFDDGPHRTHTREILDVLDQHCVKATFFTVGRMSFFMAKQLKEVARRGHTIASHSWSHPRARLRSRKVLPQPPTYSANRLRLFSGIRASTIRMS
jgi:hypothetical protein